MRSGVWEDQFGIQWDKSVDKDIGVVCNTRITPETIDSYIFPDPFDPTRYNSYDTLLKEKGDKFVVVNLGFSLYERAWTLSGMENFMMAMAADPPFANLLLDRILDFNLQIIECACSYDIDAMMFGDDWGTQTGLQMGPAMWRDYIKPRISRMYRAVKSRGKNVFIHSCGKVDEIFPDLIECGLDMFNPFQPEVMDVYDVKRKFGNKLGFFGGITPRICSPLVRYSR